MKILSYVEREELKREGKIDEVNMAHWHRFLESISHKRSSMIFPDLFSYCSWKERFPGWSYGSMDKDHSAWENEYMHEDLPMNAYYK